MPNIVNNLWLIPALPLVAAGIGALLPRARRRMAASLAISALAGSLFLSLAALRASLAANGPDAGRAYFNFSWFKVGESSLPLGWVLDPLSAVMLVVVALVGLLIFVYSVGYMSEDGNFTRFFCFLSLFAAAMLGVVISNSLLLLFICWELVGLASYLLIGFWYEKPSAANAAVKAFLTTRIGDLGLFLGMIWLYQSYGTLLFYDHGRGCLEAGSLPGLAATAIPLLLFCGAIGKSGQLPLHVWLPDAMEGPTPVSALIHAATMVAAGVFLMARVYPLLDHGGPEVLGTITWLGALTAVFGALVAVAQSDIKRILAYSTISQLGYMMMGIGVGGVAVGMFHLVAHAFFKALLFLGAGSVIHGLSGEQDIRKMGALRRSMPLTFAVYAVGMMALCGVPLFFSGFWSKDEILHAAWDWHGSRGPFWLGLAGAFLTAFYMTRQLCYIFGGERPAHDQPPHESPPVMMIPLAILAALAVVFGFLGTPVWPWFQSYLEGRPVAANFARLDAETLSIMAGSVCVVALGLWRGWRLYHRLGGAMVPDPLESAQPNVFKFLSREALFNEFYRGTIIRFNFALVRFSDWLDRSVWSVLVTFTTRAVTALASLARRCDEEAVNGGFDRACQTVRQGGGILARCQDGQVQHYLRVIGAAILVLTLLLMGGCA